MLVACIGIGALIGWAAGSAAIGALLGAVVGILGGIFAVYRRYRERSDARAALLDAAAGAGASAAGARRTRSSSLLALPVFLIAGWSIAGWGLAAVLWVAVHGIDFLLARLAPADR